MSIMAARSDRALRTAGEVLLGQCRAMCGGQVALSAHARARVVVLLDDLLDGIENPTNARHQSWASLLSHRSAGRTQLDEMTAELADNTSPQALRRLCAARNATLASVLAGNLPVSIRNQFGNSHLVDYLRVTLLELSVLAVLAGGATLQPAALRMDVRALSQALGERYPGQTIEVRIPPASAVQVGAFGEGPTHTRGTPPNVVETDELTWLRLGTGLLTLDDAMAQGLVTASGSHFLALERMLPLIDLAQSSS
ncbi:MULTISPECIES: sterol carrier family protein [unclassified Luteococcus]|uniref:sterol carrier family protein n=1 Tax=unclassified Luteococcus TaxID=2639923 RepID=UPI00313F366C